MKSLLLTLIIMMGVTPNLLSQLYMGIHYNSVQTRTFDWQTGSSFEAQTSSEQGIQFDYYFPRNKKKYSVCQTLSFGASTYQRSARVGNKEYMIDFIDFPLLWGTYIPRTIEGQEFPLFDIITAIGYHFARPIYSNYTNNAAATDFMNHGLLSNIGIALYTNRGGKLELSLINNLDLGTNNRSTNHFTPYKFTARGFKVYFSAPVYKLFQKGGFKKLFQ